MCVYECQMQVPAPKTCFIICPIGDLGSRERAWSDDITNNFVIPVATQFNYAARRAIDGSRPGEITSSMIADIIDSDLVVADLTFNNANVFYELAVRHAQGKPFILIAAIGTKIPFDIAAMNTVWIDQSTFGSADLSRTELRRHFRAVVDEVASFDNPIKRHQEKLKADQSGDPLEKRLQSLEERFATISSARPVSGVGAAASADLRFARINDAVTFQLNETILGAILQNTYRLTFNPETKKSKLVTFSPDGTVKEGRNDNEYQWRVVNGRLEFLNKAGEVYSRFVYDPGSRTFVHTNETDTPSIRGQVMVIENPK
jgi:hypothetical protein